ncbi:disease resistance protein RPM1-like [Camellia sinensis]|uniref:disease resistance protein RPM1-like n=1 Tax=Camellia sinensis TaxID=4442 RepID=UPI001036E1FF|nr:disease resistance protein RPM1-like [Camellia sinensis]
MSMDHVHQLEALSEEKAWELFCKKAFHLDSEGHCPPELEEVSHAIVRKSQGLPLAIAAIGGLLSTQKKKGIFEWQKFYGSMHSELERNPNHTSIKNFLLFSYNDLPHYLKSCFLYFGIMPEDYSICCGRLIRLWITEGFIEKQNGKTLEEVAEEYLTELIHRRLVQVSITKFDERVKKCRVHDVVREIILSMSEEFSLCQILEKENPSFNNTTRRLSMHMRYCNMDKVMESISKSPIRSVFLFQGGELPKKPLLVGVKIQRGIGALEELQNLWYVETNHGPIKELEKLRQLKKLGITKLDRELGRALCAAIEKMKYLKTLSVLASSDDEILDLQYISSSPPQYLQRLDLVGCLEKLPD